MKIVHITNVWPPYHGGQGKVAYEEVKALHELGHKVQVITFDQGAEEKAVPWPVYYMKPKIKLGLAGIFYTATPKTPRAMSARDEGVRNVVGGADTSRFATRPDTPSALPRGRVHRGFSDLLADADLIQLHYPSFGLDLGLLWYVWRKKARHQKIVIFYHMDPVGRGVLGLIFFCWQRTILPLLVAAANLILGSTHDYLEHSLISRYLTECHKKSAVLFFGVAAKFFENEKLPWPKPYFLCVGSLDTQHENKNLNWLIETWSQANLSHRAELVIVGAGNLKSAYEAYTENINAHGINFVGRVSAADLPKYYAGAVATILPAKSRTEAFGLVQLESLAAGTPVIVQDIWGVREVAKTFGHEAGFVIPVGDSGSLISLMSYILNQRLRFHGQMEQLKNNWSWQNHGQKLAQIYEGLVNQ